LLGGYQTFARHVADDDGEQVLVQREDVGDVATHLRLVQSEPSEPAHRQSEGGLGHHGL
jgi:hypothetical protein